MTPTSVPVSLPPYTTSLNSVFQSHYWEAFFSRTQQSLSLTLSICFTHPVCSSSLILNVKLHICLLFSKTKCFSRTACTGRADCLGSCSELIFFLLVAAAANRYVMGWENEKKMLKCSRLRARFCSARLTLKQDGLGGVSDEITDSWSTWDGEMWVRAHPLVKSNYGDGFWFPPSEIGK